ncbi:MAG: hypothetical protein HRT44_12180, partial [Bdellovibrionales bacterium]|nr:hypothetical protein [Bdellovibrionales bacterium]NQZ19996.1 hypothetical protein [Bdellovibrionales bacterium]
MSVLDAPKLSVRDRDQAEDFIRTYGFDGESEEDTRKINTYFRQAVAFLRDHYVEEGDVTPSEIFENFEVEDVRDILVHASYRKDDREKIQLWACATLKVMHVMAHLNSDLYSIFDEEIREQILEPIKELVRDDPIHGSLALQSEHERIKLNKFEVKPSK